ncbi:uncharacterized protein EKO05_0010498 [Ascochyta rabiei]|uniref:Uncharacterized protein n=1 Tax=Didymella rabiei TaxID=5454 RepID=A0A163GQH1_DIDRA|nr:uncharacterized protein EKO05_0010498 [Ascochyta rabiei]KZM24962.1 hypothetical protein ST47_g3901 [Ascochyta rabiei]UPX20259.1 hypothetical protein EKO05_0010498 [Ascochyta rabiei]
MPLNSLRDAIGHVENALFIMKAKRHENQSDGMAYGNNYHQYHNSAPIIPQNSPPQHNYGQPPYCPPAGWSQHWDHSSQRHYYMDQATSRSQWEPPANQFHQPPRPTSAHQQRYSDEQVRGNSSGEHNRQHLRPHSNSNMSQVSRNGSPLPRAMSIPPGYSLDTKTGQLVSTMLPPAGHHSAPVKYW